MSGKRGGLGTLPFKLCRWRSKAATRVGARSAALRGCGRCHQADAGVATAVLLAHEGRRDDIVGMIDACKAGRKVSGMLGGLEQAIAVRIVVTLLRPEKAGLGTEVDKRFGQQL